jgi:uncharacterized protein
MTYVFPYHTAIYTAVLGLLAAVLTVNVIVNRVRAKVDFADGGVAALGQAIRAHANFAEHTPLALLLIGLVEAFGYPALAVNGLGGVFLLARLLSAWGLNTTLKQSFGRQTGASLTVLVTAISAALIIYAVVRH